MIKTTKLAVVVKKASLAITRRINMLYQAKMVYEELELELNKTDNLRNDPFYPCNDLTDGLEHVGDYK